MTRQLWIQPRDLLTQTMMVLMTRLTLPFSVFITFKTGLLWLPSQLFLVSSWFGASTLDSWRRSWQGRDSSGWRFLIKRTAISLSQDFWLSKTCILWVKSPKSCVVTTICSISIGTDKESSNTSMPSPTLSSSSSRTTWRRQTSRTWIKRTNHRILTSLASIMILKRSPKITSSTSKLVSRRKLKNPKPLTRLIRKIKRQMNLKTLWISEGLLRSRSSKRKKIRQLLKLYSLILQKWMNSNRKRIQNRKRLKALVRRKRLSLGRATKTSLPLMIMEMSLATSRTSQRSTKILRTSNLAVVSTRRKLEVTRRASKMIAQMSRQRVLQRRTKNLRSRRPKMLLQKSRRRDRGKCPS